MSKNFRRNHVHFQAGNGHGYTGYCVSTLGLDEQRIRPYIREQEELESGQRELDPK